MSTDSHGPGEQPTAPIPRTGRHDDPTQIFETFGERQEPARTDQGAGAPATTTAAPPGATAAPTAPTTPAATTAERPVSRTLRVGTVVWGLVIAIIGAGLVSVAAGARFDVELVLIGLLALAGVALVAGSLAVSVRRRH